MRQVLIKAAWVVGAFLGAFIVFVLGIVIFANTNPGRGAVASLLNPLLGGNLTIHGLSGRFPDEPTAEHVEISDDHGVWLKLEHVSAQWSPLQLLRNRISAHSISAESATLVRLPIPSGPSGGNSPPMDFKRVSIGRLTIGEAVASHPAVLSLNGTLYYTSKAEFAGVLHARRLDAPGAYEARGQLNGHDLTGTASVREPGGGLIAGVLRLPDIGPLAIDAAATGPRDNNRVTVSLAAGPLRATAKGTLDLLHHGAAFEFAANSPADRLSSDLAWQSLSVAGRMTGAFEAPDVSAHLTLQGLAANGGSVQTLVADVRGRHGDLVLSGTAGNLRLPGNHPELFAATPVTFGAHAVLGAGSRTVDMTFGHALLAVAGHLVEKDGMTQGAFALKFPALAPFAAAEGIDARGSAQIDAVVTAASPRSTVAIDGALKLDGGASRLAGLLGGNTRLVGLATVENGTVTIDQARVDGTAASVRVAGRWLNGAWDIGWNGAFTDLSRVVPTLSGHLDAKGTITGRADMLSVAVDGTGTMATKGFASGPLRVSVRANGLPRQPTGSADITGTLDGSPLVLSASASRTVQGGWKLLLDKANWRSLRASGSVTAAPNLSAANGRLDLHAGRLADVQPILGQTIGGSLDGFVAFAQNRAHVTMAGRALEIADAKIGALAVNGDVETPLTRPIASLAYSATDVARGGISGSLGGTIDGAPEKLAIAMMSGLRTEKGQAVQIASAALADIPKRQVLLTKFDVSSSGRSAQLAAPARFDLANGLAVDALKLHSRSSEIDIAGRITPALNATIALHSGADSFLHPFLAGVPAEGSLSASAKLSGTLAAPQGTVTVTGRGVRVAVAEAGAAPPADITATAVLHGSFASVRASAQSGQRVQLNVAGDIPFRPTGSLNLHAEGKQDLAILDPVLNAEGRSLHGSLTLDGTVTGSIEKPNVAGTAQVTHGEFQDYVRGIHIQAISASFDAHGSAVAIDNFSARAGEGTITGSGSIDLAAPGEPISLSVVAKNAKPVSNDILNAALDANLKLTGRLSQQFTLSGDVNVRKAEIDIPDSLPPSVAVLNLRAKGIPPPPLPIALLLDLTLRSDGQLFVRGHGIDAEMSGKVHIGGTTLAPDVSGGFELRRGNLSLAGQSLDFTSGEVTFDGSSLRERIDPALDFIAQTTSGGTSATLAVTGHASAPKIALTSSPQLPQDEILAHLLFQQNTTQLSPWQLAQLGQALVSLSGMGGLGDPLARVRKSLGLDRLAVTTAGATGSQTAVEAGRYVARHVYVGAKQSVSGANGTQAVVQVDLTKHLKLQTQISSNNAPTPVSPGTTPVDTGSNIGLSYQFEY
ncbi:MAG: translocation/assembly module TamB domain-containing protein [Rhizomicrobium sp.]|jgi:translocation and assembly module TamB